MITTCTTCGKLYDSGSEEQANEPTRYCRDCWAKRKTACKHSLDISPTGHLARCNLCGFVGRWRDGVWEKVEECAPGMAYACARRGKAWREGDIYPPPDRRDE